MTPNNTDTRPFNKEIGAKIFKARKNKKMSRAVLGKIVNLHESTVKRYEDGEIKTLDIEKMKEFAKALDISPEYLMGWDSPEEKLPVTALDNTVSNQFITVYGKVCAGEGIEAFEEPITQIINPYPSVKGELFALEVHGDSMNNVVSDGMYAIIKRQTSVENGEIAVVLIDHQIGMLKRFSQHDDVVILRPDSNNPNHKPLTFFADEINDLKILGKYVGAVTPLAD